MFATNVPHPGYRRLPLHMRVGRQGVVEMVRLAGHSTGGPPGERLMERLGMPISDDTILRQLKRGAADAQSNSEVWAVGIDDWSWRRGTSYGIIMVDLDRRSVVDILDDRSVESTASGFGTILPSRSSAGTAAACMRRPSAKAHLGPAGSRSVSSDPEPSLGNRRTDEPFWTCHRQSHPVGGRCC